MYYSRPAIVQGRKCCGTICSLFTPQAIHGALRVPQRGFERLTWTLFNRHVALAAPNRAPLVLLLPLPSLIPPR